MGSGCAAMSKCTTPPKGRRGPNAEGGATGCDNNCYRIGVEDLKKDDQYLMELVLNMNSLKESSGESQEYWLLAIAAARKACKLRQGGTRERKRTLETNSQWRAHNFVLTQDKLRSNFSGF